LEAQAQALRAGCSRFAEHAARLGLRLPDGVAPLDLPAAHARMRELVDWLDGMRSTLPAVQATALDAILRASLREQLRIARKRIPLTDFSTMTTIAKE